MYIFATFCAFAGGPPPEPEDLGHGPGVGPDGQAARQQFCLKCPRGSRGILVVTF